MTAEDDARERLANRYSQQGRHPDADDRRIATGGDAVRAVATALWATRYYVDGVADSDSSYYTPEKLAELRSYYPVPTRDDVLDALAQIAGYRDSVETDEHRLIKAARAFGVEWDEVGEALGYPTNRAGQSARSHLASLTKKVTAVFSSPGGRSRRPKRRPLVDEQPAGGEPQ